MKRNIMDFIRIIYLLSCIFYIGHKLRKLYEIYKKKKRKKAAEYPIIREDIYSGKKNEKQLQFTLESVNSWINNCDLKASILLGIVGVAITIIASSDFLKNLHTYIFKPFLFNLTGKSYLPFSWGRFTVFALLLIVAVMLVISCYYLFLAISANINYKKLLKDNPELETTSYIFYGKICRMKYKEFKKDNILFIDDLKSQIYINSNIAMEKFKNYNKGLYWVKFMLIVSIMLFIAIMFIQ